MYKLRFDDDPILREPCEEVTEFNSEFLTDLAYNMFHIMYESKGIGIAAPQVGCSKRVIIVSGTEGKVTFMCNPVVVSSDNFILCPEACLSFPNKVVYVNRPRTLEVSYYSLAGEKLTLKTEEPLLAQCISHEVDHINSIVLTDYA